VGVDKPLNYRYRLFAELLSIAVRAGFRLPILRPPLPPRPMPVGSAQPTPPGLIPAHVLHHAGYYFYLSGVCAVERRDRFAAVSQNLVEGAPISAAIVHESKVDHAELIIDVSCPPYVFIYFSSNTKRDAQLYTRSYEEFKIHRTSRMSLFIASRIALIHYESGNYAMALK
jgi:hypothetical protein